MYTNLVEYVVRALVDNPTTLCLRVAEDGLGRVIGTQGRTAKALRMFLHASAARSNRRAVLEILE